MSKMRPFLAARFALPISVWCVFFSLTMLGALVFFVDDVASVLTVYFDLNVDQKWQIISKFKTPLLIALITLIIFNVIMLLLCVFYSNRLSSSFDTMTKWLDLIIVGEDRRLAPVAFSPQAETLSRKLHQLQHEFAHSRNTNKEQQADLHTITRYLHDLQSSATKPQLMTLTTAPEIAHHLNELATQLFPPPTDKAQ